ESHAPPALPDGFVPGRVGIDSIDLKRDKVARRRAALSLPQRRVTANETVLAEIDPAVHAGHAGGVGLGEFARPDTEALLQPQRIGCVVAVFANTVPRADLEQGLAQGGMLRRMAVYLVAEFAGDGQAPDPRTDKADVQCRAPEERQGLVADVLMSKGSEYVS